MTTSVDTESVAEIRRRCAGGETQSSVARHFGVDPSTVCKIVNQRRWAD